MWEEPEQYLSSREKSHVNRPVDINPSLHIHPFVNINQSYPTTHELQSGHRWQILVQILDFGQFGSKLGSNYDFGHFGEYFQNCIFGHFGRIFEKFQFLMILVKNLRKKIILIFFADFWPPIFEFWPLLVKKKTAKNLPWEPYWTKEKRVQENFCRTFRNFFFDCLKTYFVKNIQRVNTREKLCIPHYLSTFFCI